MSKQISVLVFPAGEVNSVELHDALSSCVNIVLYGASSIERHGKYIFKNYIGGLPMLGDSNFLYELNKIINTYNIDVIFPTHDTVATFFADNRLNIKSKLITGDAFTSKICRSKQKTYDLFSDCDFIPHIYSAKSETMNFPVFIKPDEGQGSIGAKKINSLTELANINFKESVVSEYLPGKEFTIDCITDKNGVLKFVSPRSRDRLLAGISVSGETQILTDEIKNIAEIINSRLHFLGLWFFQIKQDKVGRFKLLEISTRCAGTMCLTRACGVNLPLLSVYSAMGYDIDVYANPYRVQMDRTLISRYFINYIYNTVYFDLDDTLIANNKVNLNAIRFLYQCKNQGKHVILISKHEKNIEETLSEYAISYKLFSEIIHLKPKENKSDYINPLNAIFIDNAFQERKAVFTTYGIPVFDVDGIEFLLDWRS